VDFNLAVGDIIVDLGAASSALDFQPAAGVEVVITFVAREQTAAQIALFDGTLQAFAIISSDIVVVNMKMGITNTNRLRITSTANEVGFSGIQTK